MSRLGIGGTEREQTEGRGKLDEDHGAGLFGRADTDPGNLDGPEQAALFRLEGTDEDGCVWICSAAGRHVWCQNLGPFQPTAEAMTEWLEANDYGE